MPERTVAILVAFALFMLWISGHGPWRLARRLATLPLRLLFRRR
jgi:hypothetical protein